MSSHTLYTRLKTGVGIRQQLLKVRLEPRAGLGGRRKRIRVAAVGVVAYARAVGCTVALSARLDPDEGVLERVAGVGRGADTEARTLEVAPVSPGVLGSGLDTVAS